MSECIFCKILTQGLEASTTVYEDEHVIALVSLHQKVANLGHILLLPKAHFDNLYSMSASIDSYVMAALREISIRIKKILSADGIQIRQNNEVAAGQDVFHLHFHIIPRFMNDDFEKQAYVELGLKTRESIAAQLRIETSGTR